MRNPYFQILEQKKKLEHCKFCQAGVKLNYCKECQELISRECLECDSYLEEKRLHICELNNSIYKNRE